MARNIPRNIILGDDTLRLECGVIDPMGNIMKWFGSEWSIIPMGWNGLASLATDMTISTLSQVTRWDVTLLDTCL